MIPSNSLFIYDGEIRLRELHYYQKYGHITPTVEYSFSTGRPYMRTYSMGSFQACILAAP